MPAKKIQAINLRYLPYLPLTARYKYWKPKQGDTFLWLPQLKGAQM